MDPLLNNISFIKFDIFFIPQNIFNIKKYTLTH